MQCQTLGDCHSHRHTTARLNPLASRHARAIYIYKRRSILSSAVARSIQRLRCPPTDHASRKGSGATHSNNTAQSRYKRHETILARRFFAVHVCSLPQRNILDGKSSSGASSTRRGLSPSSLYLQHAHGQPGDAPLTHPHFTCAANKPGPQCGPGF